ncbi:transcriptional regulator [Escherichia coli]|uniref:Transcriptional regulator n=1 Tax=Escherichia coli TaxID=562 RepID=A0A2X1QD79_ECOLX|nr:transcriptional regulator [Escherichia coli]
MLLRNAKDYRHKFKLMVISMIPKRLKEARLRAKLTQEKLGVLAGIEEATAYSRLSHYESGTHKPTF